ncbi:M13 family metallopeptidase [Aurantibacillus circumpalustris]|uniref:M13 family metallopeptidase n=1 Tax=Aurantibacillus circumpalustris TaxID=3036359 RepID=UPI00295A6C7A|nr:M13 family metallopeptidase [Aurantibacillus circumpalustris]
MKIHLISLSTLFIIGASSCKNEHAEKPAEHYFDTAGMDTTIKPGDNFFLYANGEWMKTAVIPDDQSGWGSFYTLYQDNLKKLKGLLEDAAQSKSEKGSVEQKLGDYYASGMDTIAIEKLGAEPLKEGLAKIDAIKDYKDLMNFEYDMQAEGEGFLIALYVGADEKNSSQNIAILYQTGTTLPEKAYYTRKDSASEASRMALVNYAEKMFVLTGTDAVTANKYGKNILALETEIAKTQRSRVEMRDPQANYNKMSVAALEKLSPNINWKNFLTKLNIHIDTVNVGQPGYYEGLSKLLVSQPIDIWKTKLKFDYITSNAALLSKDFTDADFQFGKIFNGQKKDSDRWKKMTNRVDRGLGEMLGQIYVKKYFNETAKQRMDELVNNLQKAFENRIKNLDWMSTVTKEKATTKLHTFLKKIGYPEKWKNYDDVTIDRNNFFANVRSVRMHNHKEDMDKIGKPVDRMEWGMSPPTVNAYYNPSNNEIVFPAGILQFPFFNANADDAVNYGAIGMVIGHEMTHGFDDQGSQYDDLGNMKNWWTSEDSVKFKSKTSGVVNQYNNYTVLDNQHVNGELTLGENLADIGGLAIAYDAFKMTKQGKEGEKIDGFTPDQRFFLGYAQVWRLVNREEILRTRINTDPHSPEMFRVNGPSANFEPFYAAFNIQPTDKMYIKPEERARIW